MKSTVRLWAAATKEEKTGDGNLLNASNLPFHFLNQPETNFAG